MSVKDLIIEELMSLAPDDQEDLTIDNSSAYFNKVCEDFFRVPENRTTLEAHGDVLADVAVHRAQNLLILVASYTSGFSVSGEAFECNTSNDFSSELLALAHKDLTQRIENMPTKEPDYFSVWVSFIEAYNAEEFEETPETTQTSIPI